MKDLCRRHGISPATYYQWTSNYSRLQASGLTKMRELERNDARLEHLHAETALENQALKELIHREL